MEKKMNSIPRRRENKRNVCRDWLNGRCRYGDRCKYLHQNIQPVSEENRPISSEDPKPVNEPVVESTSEPSAPKKIIFTLSEDLRFDTNTFGPNVVKVNRDKGLLFGPVLPEDFTKEYDTNTLSFSLKYLLKDLQMLLRLSFNHFLSHILYDPQLKLTIQSFLQYMPRVYDHKYVSDSLKELYDDIFKCILRLFEDEQGIQHYLELIRSMNSHRDVQIDQEYYYSQLKKEFFVDIFFFIDLVSIYGRENKDSLRRILVPILSSKSFSSDLMNLKVSLCENYREITKTMKSNLTEEEFLNYISLLTDMTQSTCEFIEVYNKCILSLCSSANDLFVMEDSLKDEESSSQNNYNLFCILKRVYAYVKNIKLYKTEELLSSLISFSISLLRQICDYGIQTPDIDLFDESPFYSWVLKASSMQSSTSMDHRITQDESFYRLIVHLKNSFPSKHYNQLLSILHIDEQAYMEKEKQLEAAPSSQLLVINGKSISKEEEQEIEQVKSIFPDYSEELIYEYIQQYNHNIHTLVDDILNNKAILRRNSSKRMARKDSQSTKPRTYRDVLNELFSKQEIEELHNLRIGKKIEKDYFHSDAVYDQNNMDHSDEPDCNIDMKKYKQFQKRLIERYEYGDDYDEEDYRNMLPMESNPNHELQDDSEENQTKKSEITSGESNEENDREIMLVNDDLPSPTPLHTSQIQKNEKQTPRKNNKKNNNSNEEESKNGNTKKVSKNSEPKRDKNRMHNMKQKQKENEENIKEVQNTPPVSEEKKENEAPPQEETEKTQKNYSKPYRRTKTRDFAHDHHNRKANYQKKMSRGMI